MTAPIRVVLADDHSLFRRGVRNILEEDERLAVVGEAADGGEVIRKAFEHKPDVIIMDALMPVMNGIQAARRIKQDLPETGILIMSAVDDDAQIFEAIGAGASGYLVKDEDPSLIVQAVHSASDGQAYLPPEIARRVLAGLAGAQKKMASALTERELSVLRMLAEGQRNRAIARALCLSERTVGSEIAGIYQKLGVQDRAQAVLCAIRMGLIDA